MEVSMGSMPSFRAGESLDNLLKSKEAPFTNKGSATIECRSLPRACHCSKTNRNSVAVSKNDNNCSVLANHKTNSLRSEAAHCNYSGLTTCSLQVLRVKCHWYFILRHWCQYMQINCPRLHPLWQDFISYFKVPDERLMDDHLEGTARQYVRLCSSRCCCQMFGWRRGSPFGCH